MRHRERTRKQIRSKLKLTLRGTYRPNGIEITLGAIERAAKGLASAIERSTGKPCPVEQLLRDVEAPTRPRINQKVLVVSTPRTYGKSPMKEILEALDKIKSMPIPAPTHLSGFFPNVKPPEDPEIVIKGSTKELTDYQRKAMAHLEANTDETITLYIAPRGPGRSTQWAEMRTMGDPFPIGHTPVKEG
jgi:hypothetical protein